MCIIFQAICDQPICDLDWNKDKKGTVKQKKPKVYFNKQCLIHVV